MQPWHVNRFDLVPIGGEQDHAGGAVFGGSFFHHLRLRSVAAIEEPPRPFADVDADDIKEDEELAKKYAEAKGAAATFAMSESAKRGRDIFFTEKGNCTACHVGANLADEKYHNLGIGMDQAEPDLGRFVVSKDTKDKGAFKTPTLRDIARSGPYMHDGSLKTLEEVVAHYNKGGTPNPQLDEEIFPLKLTDTEAADLLNFLKEGLASASYPNHTAPELPK